MTRPIRASPQNSGHNNKASYPPSFWLCFSIIITSRLFSSLATRPKQRPPPGPGQLQQQRFAATTGPETRRHRQPTLENNYILRRALVAPILATLTEPHPYKYQSRPRSRMPIIKFPLQELRKAAEYGDHSKVASLLSTGVQRQLRRRNWLHAAAPRQRQWTRRGGGAVDRERS